MPIRDIKNHLDRFEARYQRNRRIEALRTTRSRKMRIVRYIAGGIALLCAGYAVALQF